MKIAFRDIERFVTSPDPAARVILVYGPDDGLMRERSQIIGKTVVADLNDPFNVCVLSPDQLSDDPSLLNDEANAISMMGGQRLIRIEEGGDKLTTAIKDYLENPNDQALILIQGGELGPRSSLRKLCEGAQNAAALPCYVEDERDVARFIENTVQNADLRIERDAVQWLAANINGDRLKVRGEIEKLILYKGAEEGAITLADAMAACGQAGAGSLDELVFSVAGGQSAKALQFYYTLAGEGVAEIAMIRALQNHFRRLHLSRSHMNNGKDMLGAIKSLTPPLFFKFENAFKSQLERWSEQALINALGKLGDLEAQSKQTGNVVDVLCAQTILGLSARAGR